MSITAFTLPAFDAFDGTLILHCLLTLIGVGGLLAAGPVIEGVRKWKETRP